MEKMEIVELLLDTIVVLGIITLTILFVKYKRAK